MPIIKSRKGPLSFKTYKNKVIIPGIPHMNSAMEDAEYR